MLCKKKSLAIHRCLQSVELSFLSELGVACTIERSGVVFADFGFQLVLITAFCSWKVLPTDL